MGCAFLGEDADSPEAGVAAVQRAYQHGIRFFDTDPGYLEGRSEPRLGEALRDLPRNELLISTKVGTRPGLEQDFSADATRRSVEQSLEALGVDYLDLCLIHDPEAIEPPLADGAALDTLVSMKDEGLIGATGLGCREHTYHQQAIATGKLDVVLTFRDYTLTNQSAAIDTVPLAQQHDLGIILASVLDMGTLAGDEPPPTAQPAHDMYHWCRERGYDVRDFALQFVLALPMDGCALTGPSTPQQVDEVVDSATRTISTELWEAFQEAFGISPGAQAGTEPQ